MKKPRLTVLLTCVAVATSGVAQSQPDASQKQYFFVLLTRPADPPQLSKEAGEKLQEDHMANIRRLATEQKLLVAGPFMDNTSLRGIFVLHAESLDQAQEWSNGDPAVHAGRLAAQVYGPWLLPDGALHEVPADTKGMEQYTLVLMKRGDKWDPRASSVSETLEQHYAFLNKMTSEENVAVAGPFPVNAHTDLNGVAIFRVGIEKTNQLLQDDPAVKAGVLVPEVHPWITGKGVLKPGQPFEMKE